MRLHYSSERREFFAALNRGKSPSPDTIKVMRTKALLRSAISDETRKKISANSVKAQLYLVARVDGSYFLTPDSTMELSITLRTLSVVANFLNSSEKTIRRALAKDGFVKKEWHVKVLGPAVSL